MAVIASRCGGDAALLGHQQPLGNAETVLFIDHHKAEVLVGHRFLKDRMGADHNIDAAIEQPHQHAFARPALVAPGQRARSRPRWPPPACARFQNAGERGFRSAPAARPVRPPPPPAAALRAPPPSCPMPTSPCSSRSIGVACAISPAISAIAARLRAGQRERQVQHGPQRAVPCQRLPAPRPVALPHQQQGQRIGEQFVIGEPVARRCIRPRDAPPPAPPASRASRFAGEQRWRDPFRQLRRAGQAPAPPSPPRAAGSALRPADRPVPAVGPMAALPSSPT